MLIVFIYGARQRAAFWKYNEQSLLPAEALGNHYYVSSKCREKKNPANTMKKTTFIRSKYTSHIFSCQPKITCSYSKILSVD